MPEKREGRGKSVVNCPLVSASDRSLVQLNIYPLVI